ncbi:helix-turn-helix transcriptional regulator [Frankia sp. QA3]|uniref:helix-turn-helix transcriptional regulator n=1 Tax=Frankia sp. QA3 TaxID=710111 RepID=UPI000269CD7E|nr:helix-turn-helix transcriptional regulator [Frankia sp. QA3]EIV96116.1 putative transcriptional regulator [Frankia sp. QA3]
MSGSRELGRALRGWRDRTAPATVGLPVGGVRRAAGLRREEVAQLAGLSVDYLVRLEQGRATSPSAQVLSALARALRLSPAEREHLYLLAGQWAPGPGQVSAHIPPGVRRLLDQLDGAPLSVWDAAWNLILWNPLWAALIGDPSARPGRERNIVWLHFIDPPCRISNTPEQEVRFRAAMVGDLRAAAARYPADAGLRALIKDLRAASTAFADLWDAGAVGVHEAVTKTVHHPTVGVLTLDCDVLTAPGADLRIVAYTAAPGSDAADRLRLLDVIGTQAMAADSTPQ